MSESAKNDSEGVFGVSLCIGLDRALFAYSVDAQLDYSVLKELDVLVMCGGYRTRRAAYRNTLTSPTLTC